MGFGAQGKAPATFRNRVLNLGLKLPPPHTHTHAMYHVCGYPPPHTHTLTMHQVSMYFGVKVAPRTRCLQGQVHELQPGLGIVFSA